MRRCFSLFGWLVCFFIASIDHSAIAEDRPNIVWLLSEDNSIHYHRTFFEHGTSTPRIDELASHGLHFQNAFSNAPVCSVARTTLITGCYAPRIGTQFHRRSVSVPMPDGVKMFPALLREAGYYTSNNNKKDYNADESEGTWDQSSKKATWRDRTEGQPFFHMQSFTTTHESSLHFDEESFLTKPTQTDPDLVHVAPYHPDTPLFRYTVAKYHDNIRQVDQQIGQVVDMLEQDGLLEDTFIFYFGDHGGVLPRGKGYAYESGLHVPLVIRIPEKWRDLVAWRPGSKVDGFVEFIDFAPTVLNLAGLEIPAGIDGKPFLGRGIVAADVEQRDTALGYADRFDEKYDLVRTLRHGKYEYVRSYQPFNIDGLQNNYRYIMLAYEQWRDMYEAGQLNDQQSQFFRARPAEMLFDLESDPHEVTDLSRDPRYQELLFELRHELSSRLKSLPDLSFYPESYLAENAFSDPVRFGQSHREAIASYLEIADLSLVAWPKAEDAVREALHSADPIQRYWGLIVCSAFGSQAESMKLLASQLAHNDKDRLVRTRAAEFLGLIGAEDPRPVLMACLKESRSAIEANLILNSVVLLRDTEPGYAFKVTSDSLDKAVIKDQDVQRRLSYLAAPNRKPLHPQGKSK